PIRGAPPLGAEKPPKLGLGPPRAGAVVKWLVMPTDRGADDGPLRLPKELGGAGACIERPDVMPDRGGGGGCGQAEGDEACGSEGGHEWFCPAPRLACCMGREPTVCCVPARWAPGTGGGACPV